MSPATGGFHFTSHSSVQAFSVSLEEYLSTTTWTKEDDISAVATGAIVLATGINNDPSPRVLLIRRAASDSMPGLWETPGGAVDDTDTSIIEGAARELREETGLDATHIGPLVGAPQVFMTTRRKLRVAKFYFLCSVAADRAVMLDPAEHSDFVWASEAECMSGQAIRHSPGAQSDGHEITVPIPFTTPQQRDAIFQGFRVFEAESRTARD